MLLIINEGVSDNKSYTVKINNKIYSLGINESEIKYENNANELVSVEFIQNHVADEYKNKRISNIGDFFSIILRGILIVAIWAYDNNEVQRGPYRARLKIKLKDLTDETLHVSLERTYNSLIGRSKYAFNCRAEKENEKIMVDEDVFESPEWLRKTWNYLMIPRNLIFIAVGILIIFVLMKHFLSL